MLNKITQGDCLNLIGKIDDESLSSSIIDPPYGEGFDYDGDSNIKEAKDLLIKL